jgi:hypothetical protein
MALPVLQFELAPQQRTGVILDALQGVPDIRRQFRLRVVFAERAELMRRALLRRLVRLLGQRLVHPLLQRLLGLLGFRLLFGPFLRGLRLGLLARAVLVGLILLPAFVLLGLARLLRRLAAVLGRLLFLRIAVLAVLVLVVLRR